MRKTDELLDQAVNEVMRNYPTKSLCQERKIMLKVNPLLLVSVITCTSWLCVSDSYGNVDGGLIAYYPFDGLSGAVIDSTGSYEGTNYGAIRGLPGKIGNAFQFDGYNDYVDTLPNDAIPATTTIALWIKPTHNSDSEWAGGQVFGTVSSIRTGEHGLYVNYYEEDSLNGTEPHSYRESIVAGYYHDTGRILTPQDSFPLDQWTYLTITYDAVNNVNMYANGNLLISGQFDAYPTIHDRALMFGKAILSQNRGFNGLIDEVRIYDRVLSPTEIQQLVPEPSSLVLLGLGAMICSIRGSRKV